MVKNYLRLIMSKTEISILIVGIIWVAAAAARTNQD